MIDRRLMVFAAMFLAAVTARAQTSTLRVRAVHSGAPVVGATVRADSVARLTDASGLAVLALGSGERMIITQRIGFLPDTLRLQLRPAQDTTVDVELEAQ